MDFTKEGVATAVADATGRIDDDEKELARLNERVAERRRILFFLNSLSFTHTKPPTYGDRFATDVFFARKIALGKRRAEGSSLRQLELYEGFRCAELMQDPDEARVQLSSTHLGTPEEAVAGSCPHCNMQTYHIVTYDDDSDHEGICITTFLQRVCFDCCTVHEIGVCGEGRRNPYSSPPRG